MDGCSHRRAARHGSTLSARWRAGAARFFAALVVMALVIIGTTTVSAAAVDEPEPQTVWVDPAPGDVAEPVLVPLPELGWSASVSGSASAGVPMIPDPGSWPGHWDSRAVGTPLSPDQEWRLQQAADFYLRDGSPNGERAYLVVARQIITGGPSAQDWMDAAKFVGGFVIQTSATVVAIAGCPTTSGATCLIPRRWRTRAARVLTAAPAPNSRSTWSRSASPPRPVTPYDQ